MKNIPNPYSLLGIPEEDIVRIQADVGREDRNLLRAVCPEQGVYTYVLGHLLIKITNELRKHNITDYSRESDFRTAVLNARIVLGGLPDGTPSRAVPETSRSDDGGGTAGVCGSTTSVENLAPNLPLPDGKQTTKRRTSVKRVRTGKKEKRAGGV